ncbi:hypothetical protein [Parendozoicomonas sp. Alg238-R29]|uniref:hypothetical protein n=1 Tax=Parendozoicomonas sp. Alg238-R29 TaxID=2993446 RepID=UPI00248D9DF5|nr:hypothetical protein [Parendozoicomonas sp. Alg238-R29]
MLSENQSRLNWHLMNEARHVLSTGTMIAAGYGLHKLSQKIFPLSVLLSTAHVSMDWFLSKNLTDFAVRQITQIPLLALRWYSHNTHSFWLNSLIMQSPTLLMGAWEMWIQSQNHLPEGTKKIHTGKDKESFQILFSNIDAPHFVFQFSRQQPESCHNQERKGCSLPYHKYLEQLSCTAYQSGVRTLEIKPESNGSTSKDVLKIKVTKNNGKAFSKEIAVTPAPQKDSNSQNKNTWLTEILAKSPEQTSVGMVLSPLAEGALAAIVKTLKGDSSPQAPALTEDELTVTVVGGKSMIVAGLGDGAYLLSDHTDTQGLALPELWLSVEPLISHRKAAAALKTLEEKRRPGPEHGIWRLLSATRSITHHTLLDKTLRWFTEGRNFTKDGFTNITDDEDITQIEANRLESDLQTDGIHIVLAGRGGNGKSHIAHHLTGTNVFSSKRSLIAPTGFKSLSLPDGNRVTELPTLLQKISDQRLRSVRSRLTSKIDHVIYVKGAHTRVEDGEDQEFEEVVKLFSDPSEAQKRIVIAFNNRFSNITGDDLNEIIDEMKQILDKSPRPLLRPGYEVVKFIEGDEQNTSELFKKLRNRLQGNNNQ